MVAAVFFLEVAEAFGVFGAAVAYHRVVAVLHLCLANVDSDMDETALEGNTRDTLDGFIVSWIWRVSGSQLTGDAEGELVGVDSTEKSRRPTFSHFQVPTGTVVLTTLVLSRAVHDHRHLKTVASNLRMNSNHHYWGGPMEM